MRLNRKIRNLLIVGLAALITTLITVYFYLTSASISAEPVPNPNGYDDFVAAGKLLTEEAPDRKTATLTQLQAYLSINQAALERARLGLTKECATPTVYTGIGENLNIPNFNENPAWCLAPIKKIAVTFCLVGRKAELEGHSEEAAQAYLSAFKIGTGISHNALLINALVSIAIESIASSAFEELTPKLTAVQCRSNLVQLEKFYRDQEHFSSVIIYENRFIRSCGLKLRLQEMISARSLHPEAIVQEKAKVKYDAQLLKLLRLQKDMAARAYELETGHKPDKWDDLVPAYLKTIPLDPASGAALQFGF